MKIIIILMTALVTSAFARDGGNSSGGGGPYKVSEGALKLLIEGSGLKNAMINYLKTLPVDQVEDSQVKNWLKKMMANGDLQRDVENSNYIVSPDCIDPQDSLVAAGTTIGKLQSDICFNTQKLVTSYQGLSEEDVMINLASLSFHEHTHHFQNVNTDKKQNEDIANRIAGYILITAKFVQLPLLKWTNPTASGPIEFQMIQSMYDEIRAKEQAFLAPSPQDYNGYDNYKNQSDRGLFRILPREKYDGKLSIRGGASYYDFKHQRHNYDYGSALELQQNNLSTGFAGCDYGYFVDLGSSELEKIDPSHPALKFLSNYIPPSGNRGAVRRAQSTNEVKENGYTYKQKTVFMVGQAFGLRTMQFGYKENANLLVVFKILRQGEDGSLVIAWKKLKEFPVPSCGDAIEE